MRVEWWIDDGYEGMTRAQLIEMLLQCQATNDQMARGRALDAGFPANPDPRYRPQGGR